MNHVLLGQGTLEVVLSSGAPLRSLPMDRSCTECSTVGVMAMEWVLNTCELGGATEEPASLALLWRT